jgi:hypothetical protein
MEVVRSVVRFEKKAAGRIMPALFAKEPPQLHLVDITNIRAHHIDTATTMSALPRSIASRLLVPTLRPTAARVAAPSYRAYSTNEPTPHGHKTSPEDAPAVKLTSSSTQIREESAAEGMRHRPDYNAAVDYRVSCVTRQSGTACTWLTSRQQLLPHPQARHGWK